MPDLNEKEPLFVLNATFNAKDDPYYWGPGVRNHYIIHYVKSGMGYYVCNGKTHVVSAGQCFLVLPDVLCSYYPERETPWEYCWVDFSGSEAKSLTEKSGLCAARPVTSSADCSLCKIFADCEQYFNFPSPENKLKIIACLYNLFGSISRYSPKKPRRNSARLLKEAQNIIDSRYSSESLNVNSLAALLNVSRSALYRYFMRDLLVSPAKYLMSVRISRAKELLTQTEMSIKSTAYSVGYSDQLAFSEAFKKETGFCPTEYRKKFENIAKEKPI